MAPDDDFERRSRLSLAVRILVVVAVVALPLGGYVGFRIAEATRSDPSLAVFDRAVQLSDRAETFRDLTTLDGGGPVVTDSRSLTGLGEVKLFGGLGVEQEKDGTIVSLVCLAVEPTETTGSVTCVPRSEFLRVGITSGAAAVGSQDGPATYHWGPFGDPLRQ